MAVGQVVDLAHFSGQSERVKPRNVDSTSPAARRIKEFVGRGGLHCGGNYKCVPHFEPMSDKPLTGKSARAPVRTGAEWEAVPLPRNALSPRLSPNLINGPRLTQPTT